MKDIDNDTCIKLPFYTTKYNLIIFQIVCSYKSQLKFNKNKLNSTHICLNCIN